MSRRPPSLLVLHDMACLVPLEAVMVSCTQAELVEEGPVCVGDDVVVPDSEDALLLDKLLVRLLDELLDALLDELLDRLLAALLDELLERLLEMLLDVAIELVTSVEVDDIRLELLDEDDPPLF